MTDDPRDALVDDLRYLRELDDATLLGHVQAQHLIAFAEGTIDGPAASFVREHVGGCDVCHEAMEVYRATAHTGDAADERGGEGRRLGLWDLLRRTVLAPAPALAYLVVLAVGLALWWTAPAPDVQAPGGLPVTVALYADDTLRGENVESDPIVVPWQVGRALVVLLHTDIAPGDLDGPLHVRVTNAAGRVVLDDSVPAANLPRDGVVSVILPPGEVRAGEVYVVSTTGVGALPFHGSFLPEVIP